MNDNLRIGVLGLREENTQKHKGNGKRWDKGPEGIT